MRVFKWTPDFDAYCESPIAAIWCNLIGLPIHLYDQSALFAIGKLLGTPIQVDRKTANKTRLSFARICVEIDITKPPPEEIILDIGGREMVQQVRWGKIPSYCRDCKHVGHTSDVCYASGKIERPEKRDYNYNKSTPKQKHHGDQGAKGRQDQSSHKPKENDKGTQGRSGMKVVGTEEPGEHLRILTREMSTNDVGWLGPDIVGGYREARGGEPRDFVRRRGRDGSEMLGYSMSQGLDLAIIPQESEFTSAARGSYNARRGTFPNTRGGSRGAGRHSSVGGRGDYDVDGCGESEAS